MDNIFGYGDEESFVTSSPGSSPDNIFMDNAGQNLSSSHSLLDPDSDPLQNLNFNSDDILFNNINLPNLTSTTSTNFENDNFFQSEPPVKKRKKILNNKFNQEATTIVPTQTPTQTQTSNESFNFLLNNSMKQILPKPNNNFQQFKNNNNNNNNNINNMFPITNNINTLNTFNGLNFSNILPTTTQQQPSSSQQQQQQQQHSIGIDTKPKQSTIVNRKKRKKNPNIKSEKIKIENNEKEKIVIDGSKIKMTPSRPRGRKRTKIEETKDEKRLNYLLQYKNDELNEQEREEKRVLRNRASAKRSREKKKSDIKSMKKQIQKLEENNEKLLKENKKLIKENSKLKNENGILKKKISTTSTIFIFFISKSTNN